MFAADASMALWPVAVEPVTETMSTRVLSRIAWPTTLPRPVTTLTTPAGTPACCNRAHSMAVVPLVASAGLTTAVQPAARMKGRRSERMKKGKFHGVMTPTTPSGWRSTIARIRSPMLL